MDKPHIAKIRIYPIKSLDPVEVDQITMGTFSLQHDREYAMVAEDNRYINGKRTGRVNQLKARYDLPNQLVTLSNREEGHEQTFGLEENNHELLEYLSDFFGVKVLLFKKTSGELMDMPHVSSVTVVSEASISSLQVDFKNYSAEDLRLRFRSNLEIGGTSAFWEENLFGKPGVGIRFLVGDVEMIGISPRARCNVPPRNPHTGETNKEFVKRMIESRSQSLPNKSLLPQHGNLYHLTVNTYLPENQKGKTLRLGDEIKILGPINLE